MSIQVILTSDVDTLGVEGDAVAVADGYARNYLIPQGLAIPATAGNLRRIETLKKKRETDLAAKLEGAKTMAKKLAKAACTVSAPVGADGKLFGSVTASDIAEELKRAGFEVDRKKIVLEHPLRELGTFDVEIKLHPEVVAPIKVSVVSSAAAAAEEPVPEKKSKSSKSKSSE